MDEQIQPQQPTNQEFQPLQPAELAPLQEESLRPQPDKNWIYVLVGLVIAGGAFGYYVWQKGGLFTALPMPTVSSTPTVTPDPTANWQIYRNDEFGFEFRYPKNWELFLNPSPVLS